jgi:hypothetical protein
MTIVRQNTASLTITIHNSDVNQGYLWKLARLGAARLQKFWWHTKAYGTILGVMLLTLVSLIYLGIHWSFSKLLPLNSQKEHNQDNAEDKSKQQRIFKSATKKPYNGDQA